MNSVKQLWDMQQLDIQQLEKQRILKENGLVTELNFIKDEVTMGIDEFKKQKEDYKQLKMAITTLEDQVTAYRGQIENLNSKLVDDNISNHKEMAVIYDEVQLLQQKIADIETDELILIEQQEQMRTNLEQRSEYLKARKALYDQLKADYQAFKQDLQQQILALISDKKKLVSLIADDSLQLYQKLQKRYFNPVAIVKDDVCSGCHLKLNINQRNQLKSEQQVIECDHCGRLIFAQEQYTIDLAE
jgi:hypothetical protein